MIGNLGDLKMHLKSELWTQGIINSRTWSNRDVADSIHRRVWGQDGARARSYVNTTLKRPGSQGHRRRAAARCFMEASITLIFAAVTPRCKRARAPLPA